MNRIPTGRLVLLSVLGVVLVLAACSDRDEPAAQEAQVANPAAVHCVEQGGTVELIETEDGQAGICVFADGRECEQWAYFRGGECLSVAEETLTNVEVFFINDRLGDPCGEVFPVARDVPADTPVVEAVAALLAGPTPDEMAEGYGGWFSADTEGFLRSLGVGDDGTARADFADLRPVIPNASTSCGSTALLAQLDRTLLQFPEIETTIYSINGSAEAFYEWLQSEAPAP